ncbi:hypothetical protein [Alterisphingorhabdus coralli]|uniref:DUF2955 domain-containing protein n=1 Tax=Alterisphingorhabdus coralli TaxID=3071408 RepID=A0AA97F9A6_9SPHN|nr:hypothetical protein [Parasphingorhabdus sp. SCSIO 66989]WOE75906.1 hypothetical protein RB602_04100 [Parasphingorhabdus sp. SCSIO 66989]
MAVASPSLLAKAVRRTRALPQAEARCWRLAAGFGLATLVGYGGFPAFGYMFVLTTLILLMPPVPAPKPGQVVQLLIIALVAVAWGAILGQLLFRIPILGLLLLAIGLSATFMLQVSKPAMAPVASLLIIGQTFVPVLSGPTPAMGPLFFFIMAGGTIFAVSISWLVQAFFPERAAPPVPPAFTGDIGWVGLRGIMIMLPPIMLALTDSGFLPLLIKGSFLAVQAEATTARYQARELVGSTLMGGLIAFLLWTGLRLMPDLFVFALLMATVGLIIGRNLYGVTKTRQPFTFWQAAVVTMIVVVGPSVSDSTFGQDANTAFMIRIGLFIALSIYAVLMVALLDEVRRMIRARRARN